MVDGSATRDATDDRSAGARRRDGVAVGRRAVLGTLGGALATGLAGCEQLTGQSFAATPVVLPADARDRLVLAETYRDSTSVTRESGGGDLRVTVTNEGSMYRRGTARETPTILERFASRVNGTDGAGPTVTVTAAAAGLDAAPVPGYCAAPPTVLGSAITLVVPAGARTATGDLDSGQVVGLVPGPATDRETVTYAGSDPGVLFPGEAVFPRHWFGPDEGTAAGEGATPGQGAAGEVVFPGGAVAAADPADLRVFFPDREALTFRLGLDGFPDGARRVDSNTAVETAGTVFATSGVDPLPAPADRNSSPLAAGRHYPLGGTPFGLGVLATPTGSVGGESINPVVALDTDDLLRREGGRQLLRRAGVTDSETVTWRAGPQIADPDAGHLASAPDQVALLGAEAPLETVLGIVGGEDGPWGTLLVVARVTDADHVVAAAAVTRPVAAPGDVGELTPAHFGTPSVVRRAVAFARQAISALQRSD